MTVSEVISLVGAPPGWYDGIFSGGVDTDDVECVCWIGSEGEIVAEVTYHRLLDDSNLVTKATYIPLTHRDQDCSKLVWERLTRGVLDDVPERLWSGATRVFLLGAPVAGLILLMRKRLLGERLPLVLFGIGLAVSLVALPIAGILAENNRGRAEFLLGAGMCGMLVSGTSYCLASWRRWRC
jgi:hypothetical protein